MSDYKRTHKLEKRIQETDQILKKYPDRIPILCERARDSKAPIIDKNKYLVPKDLTAYQFSFILRKRLQLPKEQSIWLFVNGKYVLKADTLMKTVYERSKDRDGFLYMTYSGENTYGC